MVITDINFMVVKTDMIIRVNTGTDMIILEINISIKIAQTFFLFKMAYWIAKQLIVFV